MPRNKDLKRLVRTRMRKTGEAYTAARAHVARKSPDYAVLAGYSDDTIKRNTGCAWDKWVFALDRHDAATLTHGEITRLIAKKYPKVSGWWTQAVAVGYERIKGLRARGQRRDGTFEASKSRTFDVPVTALFDAWADARSRKRWLALDGKVRTATEPRSLRLGMPDGTIAAVWFTPKGPARSTVAVQVAKLADRDAAARVKADWTSRLGALAEFLKAK